VLDRAAKWLSTAMSGVDAQHVETRRLQIEEICRGYGVFPIMVGHSDKTSTFASSEAFFAAHLIHTLAPWHKAWRDRLDETLLDGSGPLFAKFDTRYMVAGSMKDRAQWAARWPKWASIPATRSATRKAKTRCRASMSR
jgi:phage portal protein BeeE